MLRNLGRALVVLLARVVFGRPRPAALARPRKLLVIRTDERVGNVLLTVPLLRALRRGLPGTELVFLHAASKAALVRGLPWFDRLEPFERTDFFRRPLRFWRRVLALRRERFDLAIEAGHYHAFSLTAALLARLVGASAVIGHARGDAHAFFTHPVPPPPGVAHDVSVKLSLLGPLGLESAGLELETPLGADSVTAAEVDGLLAGVGVTGARLLLVNPGARKADRRWAPERWGVAAGRIAAAHGLVPLVLWGPGEEGIASATRDAAGAAARLAPPTDLRQLAGLMRRAALVLTNDTGPMHLATACGAPTLAVFLVADHERWGHPLPTFRAVPLAPLQGDPERELAAVDAAARELLGGVHAPTATAASYAEPRPRDVG